MSDLIKKEDKGLINLLHGQGGGLTIPKPYEHDIFLFNSHIAGTSFIEGIEELEPYLKIDERLDFFREPDNPHDSKAIVIKNSNGIKLGYVPKEDNVIFSRLMDAGKLLFGRIEQKETKGKWLKISVKIYLQE